MLPPSFGALTTHPSPGLPFPAHEGAGCGEYTLPSPHLFAKPAGLWALRKLRKKTAECSQVQAELLEFYSRWDGVGLCCTLDPMNDSTEAALAILPIGAWDEATGELVSGDLSFLLDGLEDLYVPGHFVVIAASPSESTKLVLFTQGACDGQQLAGEVFCLSMDPVLGADVPVANSFFDLLNAFGSDPAGFLNHIGHTFAVKSASGQYYGAVPDAYLADTRGRT